MAQFSFLMVLVPILGETFLEIVGGEFGIKLNGQLCCAVFTYIVNAVADVYTAIVVDLYAAISHQAILSPWSE